MIGLTRSAYLRAVDASGWSVALIEGPRRWRELVYARKAIAYALTQRGVSIRLVAHHMNRDRQTIRHGVRTAAPLDQYDGQFAKLVTRIQNAAWPPLPERLAA